MLHSKLGRNGSSNSMNVSLIDRLVASSKSMSLLMHQDQQKTGDKDDDESFAQA